MSAAIHLIPYAVIAMLSPVGFAATLTVMRTGRFTALGFGIGVVVGQLFACGLLVALGIAVSPSRGRAHPGVEALLELGLGLVLLRYARVVHQRPEVVHDSANSRSKAALERLQRVHVVTAAGVGVLLGIGGPKRLVLTALASASITAAGTTGTREVPLVLWYGLLATLLVWLPVLAYLLFGGRVVAMLDAAIEWFGRHRRPASVAILAGIGAALVLDAAILLL